MFLSPILIHPEHSHRAQQVVSCEGKENEFCAARSFDCQDWLAKLVGFKVTLTGRYLLYLRSSWDRSADLAGLVCVRIITVL